MALLIDTASVQPHERLDYWMAATAEVLMPLQIRQLEQGPFVGRVFGYELGSISVFRLAGDPTLAARTARGIRTGDPEEFGISVNLQGHYALSQADRVAVLRNGDLASWETSRPFVSDCRGQSHVELAFLSCPRELLGRRMEVLSRQTAVRISSDYGIGRQASTFLRDLVEKLGQGVVGADSGDLAESVLELLVALYGDGADPRGRLKGAGRSLLLAEVKRFVERHLGQPDLDPEGIARAHVISTRYLHKLFEAEGVSVGEWIREQRLERCRRDLADAALDQETVFSIAARAGFRSPAHFSRAFRDAYGSPPREFRSAAQHARGTRPASRLTEPGAATRFGLSGRACAVSQEQAR